MLDHGDTPHWSELKPHNGTIYRWNRPVYDVVRTGRTCASRTGCPSPHYRRHTLANGALYFGLVRRWPRTSVHCGRR